MKKQDRIRKNNPTWQFPDFEVTSFAKKKNDYCVCVFVVNESERIRAQLKKMKSLANRVDIVVADGGSTDGSLEEGFLKKQNVSTLLTKTGPGKLSSQMRMAFAWALSEGYKGIVVIDGNNKDSVERIPNFTKLLDDGFDHVQGSRFIPGGKAINTPLSREIGLHLLHAPLISLAARQRHTDTTNGFRAYSRRLLLDEDINIFRNIFQTYELHYYLAIESSSRKKYRTIETPVIRTYPKNEKTPTKISPVKGNAKILAILLRSVLGFYKNDSKSLRVFTFVSKWSFQLWLITALLAIFSAMFFYPGLASSDTVQQWKQVTGSVPVGDWHPPYMVYLWSGLVALTHKMGSLLILQQAIFWVSLGFFANYIFSRTKSRSLSLVPFVFAMTPAVIGLTGVLWKDVQLAIALLAASIILLHAHHSKKFSILMKVVSMVLILYAILLRYNAMVAALPLLLFWIKLAYPNMRNIKYWLYTTIIVGATYTGGLVVSTIGHVVQDHPTTAIMLDDLVGVGKKMEYKNVSADVRNRLSAVTDECHRKHIFINTYWGCTTDDDRRVFSQDSYEELKSAWMQAILGNPIQYVQYRTYTYSIFLFGAGEAQYLYSSARVVETGVKDFSLMEDTSQKISLMNVYMIDFAQRNFGFLFRPWFWLIVSVGILYAGVMRSKRVGTLSLMLAASSLLYILSYIPVTVATDYRYIYWSVIATSVSLIIIVVESRNVKKESQKESR